MSPLSFALCLLLLPCCLASLLPVTRRLDNRQAFVSQYLDVTAMTSLVTAVHTVTARHFNTCTTVRGGVPPCTALPPLSMTAVTTHTEVTAPTMMSPTHLQPSFDSKAKMAPLRRRSPKKIAAAVISLTRFLTTTTSITHTRTDPSVTVTLAYDGCVPFDALKTRAC